MQKTNLKQHFLSQSKSPIAAFILAKNEESNIRSCIEGALEWTKVVYVLDSGSTDNTLEICKTYNEVSTIPFNYINHCEAYNQITTELSDFFNFLVIIDADMVLDRQLIKSINSLLNEKQSSSHSCFLASVKIFIENKQLNHCSSYPPKPFLFKTGLSYFEPVGHGEQLKLGIAFQLMDGSILHRDNKHYSRFLLSQIRYASTLQSISKSGRLTWRDRIRLRSPILIVIIPLYIYIIKLGFLDGKAGLKYALDRLIAEAIMYRIAISKFKNDM